MILTSKNLAAAALASLLAAAGPAAGEDDRTKAKSGYTLFRPTPRDLMRPLSTDRPDATESPYTVDAGHLQLEADVVAYLRDVGRDDGAHLRGWAFPITNLKLGLTNGIDAQLVVETFRWEENTDAGSEATVDGFGDLVLRGKFNLWGNDEGPTAFALLPFVKFPTAGEGLLPRGPSRGQKFYPYPQGERYEVQVLCGRCEPSRSVNHDRYFLSVQPSAGTRSDQGRRLVDGVPVYPGRCRGFL